MRDPFVGTTQVSVTLLYLQCLRDFYDAHPQWSQDGPDGAVAFEAAMTELCVPEADGIECSVAEIRQELDVVRQLTVVYDVQPPIEGGTLRFGPLPTAGLAGCADGGLPIVRVGSNGAVRGLDGAGDVVWNMESFNPAEAATDQGAPITIRAAVPG